MLNVLPQRDQDAFFKEYGLRFGAAGLWFVAVLSVAASALLVPALFLADKKEALLTEQTGILQKSTASGEAKKFEEELGNLARLVNAFSMRTPVPHLYELVGSAAEARGSDVVFERMTLSSEGEQGSVVEVSGRAGSRAGLVAFVRALEGLQVFDRVELPVGNLAKDADISFSLSAIRKRTLK